MENNDRTGEEEEVRFIVKDWTVTLINCSFKAYM